MAYVFVFAAIYCIILCIRRFGGIRLPLYITKDSKLSEGQIGYWSRMSGYSMLFWAGFSVTMAAMMMFRHWVIVIPLVLLAAGGFVFSMKGSAALHDKTGKYDNEPPLETRVMEQNGGKRKKKKKKKKK